MTILTALSTRIEKYALTLFSSTKIEREQCREQREISVCAVLLSFNDFSTPGRQLTFEQERQS
jgi:hypothetical protein